VDKETIVLTATHDVDRSNPGSGSFRRANGASAGGASADDFELMRAIADGDPQALKALYDRHAGLVFTVALRVVRDRSEAEDLLTEIFFELWDKRERYNAMRGSPVSYLVTLARSRAIDRKRRKRLTYDSTLEAISAASAQPTPAESSESNERGQLLTRCFDRLEAPQRQAIECAFYDGLSHSEVATKLARPLGTIKTQIRAGLMRLRECLGRFFDSTDAAVRFGEGGREAT
jgi:RNA polymerase sigma-70 factor (ECF subfamily)